MCGTAHFYPFASPVSSLLVLFDEKIHLNLNCSVDDEQKCHEFDGSRLLWELETQSELMSYAASKENYRLINVEFTFVRDCRALEIPTQR